SPQRSDAPGPISQSSQLTTRTPGTSSLCAPSTTTISATLVCSRASSTNGSSSRCFTPPERVDAPAASTIALTDVEGRLLDLDRLGRCSLAARRRISELADLLDDGQAANDLA